MKNQYFGDVNDYRKYGLLRCLQRGHMLQLLVAWMLTPNDGRTDGEFRTYQEHPKAWRRFDSDLYDGLLALERPREVRRVAAIENTDLIARAAYFDDPVPDGAPTRKDWAERLVKASRKIDLVFLDPDNGIEVPSRPIGRKNSNKYVAWPEIKELWAAGCSLLIYQHFRREKRDEFIARMLRGLQQKTKAPFVAGFRTAHVVFLLAAQKRHQTELRRAAHYVGRTWSEQIQLSGAPADEG